MSEVDNIIQEISPYYKSKAKPGIEYELLYDSNTATLEPIYFWLLDFMNEKFGGDVEKIVDNFASSPGSGHFSEMGQKMSQMQQEASKTLGNVNNLLKAILNLIYDLKEFKIRLSHYEEANSKEKNRSGAGNLALKQIWMDKVDMQRGQGSLNALASGNLQFVTLRDAFMIVNSAKDVDQLDLNDRVKRVLKPRVQEFFEWKKRSEQELRKRFEIEKLYLKSEVNSLKLYARWAKPYLKAAQQLAINESLSTDAGLVTAFNTLILQLSVMGTKKINVKDSAIEGDLPADFAKIKRLRDYFQVILIDFNFRGIPSKAGQHYTFGGRAEVKFRAYALNQDELDALRYKLSDSDLEDSLKLVQGITDDSLGELKLDLEEFMDDEKKEKPKEFSNPFTSLFAGFTKKQIKETKEEKESRIKLLLKKGIRIGNYAEKYIRSFTEAGAIEFCYNLYDIYKKAHGMASLPYSGKNSGAEEFSAPRSKVEEFFGLE